MLQYYPNFEMGHSQVRNRRGSLGLEIEILEKQLKVNKWRDIAINMRVVRCKNIERTFSILNLFLLALNHMVTEEGNKLQN